ncbi:MAG: DNA starvation/stationary phase protection protein [Chitinophagales bacterium]|nr:DNA starvation/stationary phase protection protein [Chitinophagales bacterium]
MKISIGISEKNLKAISQILNTLLADEYVLYTKTRNYHWNVEGKDFMELHKFFEEQYGELEEILDQVAERVRNLGHFPIGSLEEFLHSTHLKETKVTGLTEKQMSQNLMNDHETVIRFIRDNIEVVDEKYKDAGTTDFITGIMQQHEKMAWMLRSYLRQ